MPSLATAVVTVANTGLRAGDQVCLVFGKAVTSAGKQGRARQELLGYGRVSVAAGAKATVMVPITAKHLSYVDEDGLVVVENDGLHVVMEGLIATLTLT